jgi:hypothetical protein
VFNPKVSGIVGGSAFVLSFLVGIITGAAFHVLLIRALIFGAGFFILTTIIYGALTLYLPDLLEGLTAGPGSQVDISVGDQEEDSTVDIFPENGEIDEGYNEIPENIGGENRDSLSGNPLDLGGEDGYTKKRLEGEPGFIPGYPGPARPPEMVFTAEDSDSVDILPDLDLMSGAFSDASQTGDKETGNSGGSPGGSADSPGKPSPGKKAPDSEFNIQEMASAIQTILKRDDKG